MKTIVKYVLAIAGLSNYLVACSGDGFGGSKVPDGLIYESSDFHPYLTTLKNSTGLPATYSTSVIAFSVDFDSTYWATIGDCSTGEKVRDYDRNGQEVAGDILGVFPSSNVTGNALGTFKQFRVSVEQLKEGLNVLRICLTATGKDYPDQEEPVAGTRGEKVFSIIVDNTPPVVGVNPNTSKLFVPTNVQLKCTDEEAGCKEIKYQLAGKNQTVSGGSIVEFNKVDFPNGVQFETGSDITVTNLANVMVSTKANNVSITPATIYAAVNGTQNDNGYVAKIVDGVLTKTPVNNAVGGNVAALTSLAANQDGSKIYVGTEVIKESNVYKTGGLYDVGNNTALYTDDSVNDVVLVGSSRANGTLFLATMTKGVVSSTATSFTSNTTKGSTVYDLFLDGNTLYMASEQGVFRSNATPTLSFTRVDNVDVSLETPKVIMVQGGKVYTSYQKKSSQTSVIRDLSGLAVVKTLEGAMNSLMVGKDLTTSAQRFWAGVGDMAENYGYLLFNPKTTVEDWTSAFDINGLVVFDVAYKEGPGFGLLLAGTDAGLMLSLDGGNTFVDNNTPGYEQWVGNDLGLVTAVVVK